MMRMKRTSVYFVISSVLLVAVVIAAWADPSAGLVMAWAVNYIPYLGAMTMYAVLTMVGFLTFPSVGHALLGAP